MNRGTGRARQGNGLRHRRQRAARLVVLAVVTAGIGCAWRWRMALDPATISGWIGSYPSAPLVFLGLQTGASLLFVPRTLFAVAAGLLFGTAWGIVWAALGGVLGAIAGFAIARYVNSGVIDLENNAWFGPVLDRVQRGGWRAVALLRLIPIVPHSLANYGLGLTGIRLAPYVFGSLVGQLPLTVACVDLGAAGERLVLGRSDWLAPTVIGALALGLTLLIPAVSRRRAG